MYGLDKADFLKVTEERVFVKVYPDHTKMMWLLTDEQNATYMRVKTEVIKNYTLQGSNTVATERDLWTTGRMKDFYEHLNPRLAEAFPDEDYDRIQKVYKIIVEPETIKYFTQKYGWIDPADTKTAAQLMVALNSIVCDGLMSATALSREVTVATRIQEHEDAVGVIDVASIWGGTNNASWVQDKRKEFQYEHVQMNDKDRKKMIKKMIVLPADGLEETLKSKWICGQSEQGCQVVERLYSDDLLRKSGLSDEQYNQIMQEAEADEEKERSALMDRLVAEAKERIAANQDIHIESASQLDESIVNEVLAEKRMEENKKTGRDMLDCGLSLDDLIGQI